jgi:hypothetical protein
LEIQRWKVDNEISLSTFFMKNLIALLDSQFLRLHVRSCELVEKISTEKLYWQPTETHFQFPLNSFGANILRSAGKVEQTFNGITTRLWDDPFEWTLPEQLSTNELILEYLNEVETTRLKGFTLLQSDEDLQREFPAPVQLLTIFELLLETLTTAENFQGRAVAVYSFI